MAHKTRKPRVTSCHMTSYNSCGTEFYFPSSKNFPLMTFPINHLNNLWSLVRNQKTRSIKCWLSIKIFNPLFVSWPIFQKVRSLTIMSSFYSEFLERSWPKTNIQFRKDAPGPRFFIPLAASAPLVMVRTNPLLVRGFLVLNSENIEAWIFYFKKDTTFVQKLTTQLFKIKPERD